MNAKINKNPEESTSVDSTIPQIPLKLKASTINTYTTIYERSMRNSTKKRQTTPDDCFLVDPIDMVKDWMATIGENKPRYANTERSALLWALGVHKPHGWQDAYVLLRNTPQEPLTVARNKITSGDRRSRAPGRMIPEEDLPILLNELITMGQAGARAQWWLVAGVASGARPIEWPDAQWIDEKQTVVRIYTAKVKARNAWYQVPPMTFTAEDVDNEVAQLWGGHSERNAEMSTTYHKVDFERRISFLKLTQAERDELRSSQVKNGVLLFRDVFIKQEYRIFVRMHMESVQRVMEESRAAILEQGLEPVSDEKLFGDNYFNPLRHTIWRACKKVFTDKLYSLVDARQTFSANRKAATGGKNAQIDLGHNSYTTSKDYYSPASRAWSKYRNMHKQALLASEADKQRQTANNGTPASFVPAT